MTPDNQLHGELEKLHSLLQNQFSAESVLEQMSWARKLSLVTIFAVVRFFLLEYTHKGKVFLVCVQKSRHCLWKAIKYRSPLQRLETGIPSDKDRGLSQWLVAFFGFLRAILSKSSLHDWSSFFFEYETNESTNGVCWQLIAIHKLLIK